MNTTHSFSFKHYKISRSALLLALLFAIAVTSFLVFAPVLSWFVNKMSLANGYLHLFAVTGLVGLAIFRIKKIKDSIFETQALAHPALLIWIPAIGFYLINEANIGFHTLSAALFLVYLYGIAGHFIKRQYWAAMLLPIGLLILVLPFEHYLDIYLGFPLRLVSAEWTRLILQTLQIDTMTVESILMIDNKAAIVDLDCSGIKSLWIGMIFYLLITWIERFQINIRWVALAALYILLLVCANVARITILVLLDLIFDQAGLAQAFHQALGLLGFAIASLTIWFLLHFFATKQLDASIKNKPLTQFKTQPFLLACFLLVTHLIALFIYQPFSSAKTSPSTASHSLPVLANIIHEEVSLSPQEDTFFTNNQSIAKKYALLVTTEKRQVKASMVLVWNRTWKAHHVPENCYTSQAYSISHKSVWNISPTLNVRHLTLNKIAQQQNNTLSGIYWFQSPQKITPDYSSRVIDGLFNPHQEWVMVSILWAEPITPEETRPIIQSISQALTFTTP